MAIFLKKDTAVTVKMGPFLDETDGKTAENALTISQADIRLSKNGGAFAQTNNAAGATNDEKGWYNVPLNTTDTNTLGSLVVAIHEDGALPVWKEFMVVTANTWDTLCGADAWDVNTATIGGNTAATVINDECEKAVNTDEMAELTTMPGATPTMRQALMLIFMALRNKVFIDSANSLMVLYNDAGTATFKKSLTDDGTDFTEDKMVDYS